jgi:hypothetical protein
MTGAVFTSGNVKVLNAELVILFMAQEAVPSVQMQPACTVAPDDDTPGRQMRA